MPETRSWSHKMLREHGIAIGQQLIISTSVPTFGLVKIICSSDQMLQRCLPIIPEAMLQWLEVESDDLVLEEEKSPEQQIIVSYEGVVSDFVHMLGSPICILPALTTNVNKDKTLPLPADFEQAIQNLIRKKRRKVILNERGSFKIVKQA